MEYKDYKQSGNIWNEFIISEILFTKLSLLSLVSLSSKRIIIVSLALDEKISNAENYLRYPGHSHWGRQNI